MIILDLLVIHALQKWTKRHRLLKVSFRLIVPGPLGCILYELVLVQFAIYVGRPSFCIGSSGILVLFRR